MTSPPPPSPPLAAPDRLLMVMPYSQFVRKAVEAGFTVWSIWDPSLREQAYLDEVALHSEELLLTDFSDTRGLRELITATARAHGIGRILHLGAEETMGVAVEAAEELGLSPNSAAAVHRLNDKAAMRRLLDAAGLSVVRAEPARSVDDVAAAVAVVAGRFAAPVIVKPSGASGSRGVALVREAADVDEWADRVRGAGLDGPFLVEEYLEGPEFSVETLTVDGVHHVVGVTAKQTDGPPGFVETGHVHPAPLSAPDESAIRAVVTGLLDLAGHRFGPAHTEVILTAGGPRIVESQARLGGDRIPLLVEVATGFDIEASVFRALAGEPVVVPDAVRTASIGFFRFPAGLLDSVAGLEEVRDLPYVHALHFPFAPGDQLPHTTDSFTRHGYVVVDGASPREAAGRIASVRERLRVVVRETVLATSKGTIR
ncbi:ATP-grasp domain-containing protein [Streptomyces sp. H34-S4]|uniref:ATP-grasp domain-containing protein n=1 Tax=Streptomyces sp. H34-S4 TaxID=2996463 RepID=UPI00226D9319|nr:ATP-grasp domain-containing protein [Streptomyces sp. H34-S4]MCY0937613.1 ATP-grasp domain-containing protein [Streptomyces sp. H34-S4]